MPELPEVESIRRSLAAGLAGATIARVDVRRAASIGAVSPRTYRRRLRGRRFMASGRLGKYLLLHLDGDETLVVHLRMSGRLYLADADEPPPHTHIVFHLADGRQLWFNDPRTFGRVRLLRRRELDGDPSLRRCGIDALDPALDDELLGRILRGSRQQLKVLLLNQRQIAGIGNIYASEICHAAGLSPRKRADRITRRRVPILRRTIVEVLEGAIAHGGTSFDAVYIGADGQPGRYQDHLQVYGRAGLPCFTCRTPIRRIVQQQRSTFYCPTCQRG